MTIEPWMLRTGLVILGLNCVNALLLWMVVRRERPKAAGSPKDTVQAEAA